MFLQRVSENLRNCLWLGWMCLGIPLVALEPIDLEPYRFPLSALQKCQQLMRSGEVEEAQKIVSMIFETAKAHLDEGDTSAVNYFILGVATGEMNEPALALHYLQRSVQANPGFLDAQLALANAYKRQGNVEKALEEMIRYADRFTDEKSYVVKLSELYVENGRGSDATALLEGIWHKDQTDERVFKLLLTQYQESGDVSKASELYDFLVNAGAIQEIDKLIQICEIQLNVKDLNGVRRTMQTARRLDPEHPALQNVFGRFYELSGDQSLEAGQLSRAILFWERSLEFAPENPEVIKKLGSAYGKSEDYKRAVELLTQVLDTKPSDAGFYLDLSKALHATGQKKAAYKTLESVIEIARRGKDKDSFKRFMALQEELLAADRAALVEGQ